MGPRHTVVGCPNLAESRFLQTSNLGLLGICLVALLQSSHHFSVNLDLYATKVASYISFPANEAEIRFLQTNYLLRHLPHDPTPIGPQGVAVRPLSVLPKTRGACCSESHFLVLLRSVCSGSPFRSTQIVMQLKLRHTFRFLQNEAPPPTNAFSFLGVVSRVCLYVCVSACMHVCVYVYLSLFLSLSLIWPLCLSVSLFLYRFVPLSLSLRDIPLPF